MAVTRELLRHDNSDQRLLPEMGAIKLEWNARYVQIARVGRNHHSPGVVARLPDKLMDTVGAAPRLSM